MPVRVTPRGGRDSLDGFGQASDGKVFLLARVRALPEDGAANEALQALLAKTLGCRKSAIKLVSGGAARVKTFGIDDPEGAAEAVLDQLWERRGA